MILSRHELPPRVGAFGGMMTALVGLLLAAPIFVGVLVRLAHPLLRRVLPIEARLASDNLIRSPGRTGVVIGALGAGVAVMIQTAGVGRSNEEPVVAVARRGGPGRPLRVRRQHDRGDQLATADGAAADRASWPACRGWSGVTAIRYVRPEYNGTVVFLIAIDAVAYAEHTEQRRPTEPRRTWTSSSDLPRHGRRAWCRTTSPSSTGSGPATRSPCRGRAGRCALTVLGTVRDYSWSRGTIFIDRTVYAELFGDDLVDVCHVFLAGRRPVGGAGRASSPPTAG